MASPYFYITDLTTTIALDDTVSELILGGNKRSFNVVEYAGSNGGILKGNGNYSPKTFKVSRREYAVGTNETAWNSRRSLFMQMVTKAYYIPIYLYVQYTEYAIVMRTRIYCTDIPEDKYKYIKVSDIRSFTFVSPDGFYEDVAVTTVTEAITTGAEQAVEVVNYGNIDCPMICKFTPTGNETIFQVLIYNNYGFRLEGSFTAGIQITYNTETGAMTIGGSVVNAKQYLTQGNVFEIPTGTSNIYVGASGPGAFVCTFQGRSI
jgi:hypothetical protein